MKNIPTKNIMFDYEKHTYEKKMFDYEKHTFDKRERLSVSVALGLTLYPCGLPAVASSSSLLLSSLELSDTNIYKP